MRESQIQKKIISRYEKEGWYVVKLIKTNKNGIPDLLLLRNGQAMMIEVKTPKGITSPLQLFRQQELEKKAGVITYTKTE